jgi:hypothetical protein
MEKGEDGRKGGEEMKRRKSGAYDMVSDARERAGDMGCEGKKDVERERECLYNPLRG